MKKKNRNSNESMEFEFAHIAKSEAVSFVIEFVLIVCYDWNLIRFLNSKLLLLII